MVKDVVSIIKKLDHMGFNSEVFIRLETKKIKVKFESSYGRSQWSQEILLIFLTSQIKHNLVR